MSAPSAKGRPPSRPGQPSYSQSNQSLLLEKVNARTSTPDSEALASSEDEGDHRQDAQFQPQQPPKPARRASWLNDMSQPIAKPRKGSFANSMSPTTSHPSTPSAETNPGPWGPHSTSSMLGRGAGAPTFSWGTGIWNSTPKDAPSRLTEVLPSPTSTFAPGGGANSFFPDPGLTSPITGSRDGNPNSQIPFAIPLHPTPKTYRSQSYSVGQLDPEVGPPAGSTSSSGNVGRGRHPGLQHRPSRPSMLSEMANDGSILGKVKEVEDDEDEDSLEDSGQGSFHQSSESKTIEMLARENAMLRQQYSGRLRTRASIGNGYPMQETVPEESDFAVDEFQDDNHENLESFARRAANRRMSEYGSPTPRAPLSLERGKTDSANLKKALWSSSLNFPVGDASQSRRHSFANMPTRQGSISSLADGTGVALDGSGTDGHAAQDYSGAMFENGGYPAPNLAYFMGGAGMAAAMPPSFSNPYGNFNPAYANRPPSPHRNMYPMGQPRQNQLLYIVLFKCARADVFYIQEGTGLTVKPGDLVIVEADRGTDLGTVAKDNVDWQTARDMKEHYAEEHYKWLIMYSSGPAAASEASAMGSSNGGSAIGGMGPPNQFHLQEPNSGELRPKLIKRLAQSHEISALREKEGQEAKAKRMCMQKVKEHGLNMEILDAEFQMDWKKLTFYYFADAYINFNSLVTDLFKIYKTRIWMSAINPASFASPALGVQAPSGIGPGAVGAGRGASSNDRRHNQPSQRNAQPYGPSPQAAQTFRPPFTDPFGTDRSMQSNQQYPATYGFGQAGAFGQPRPDASFMTGVPPGMQGYPSSSYQASAEYRPRFPNPGAATSPLPHSQGASPIAAPGDWTGAFQGLSLNSN